MITPESLVAVYTHTHTHTSNLMNKEVNIENKAMYFSQR